MRADADHHLKLNAKPHIEVSDEPTAVGCGSDSECYRSLRKDFDHFWKSLKRNSDNQAEKLGVFISSTPEYDYPERSDGCSKTRSTTADYSTSAGCSKTRQTTPGYSEETSSSAGSTAEGSKGDYATTAVPPSSEPPRNSMHVGSISGIPGINYPDYTDIPITSFTCSDKSYLPGFYADLEAGCQVNEFPTFV